MSINIAIDGPAGAGKSTIAKRVAKELEYIYVDTGAMYRAMAYYFLQKGISPEDEGKISKECKNAEISIAYQNGEQQVILNGENVTAYIRKEEVGNMASATSVYPKVREKLVELQKELAKKSNVIMDGRDIGTYVLPKAKAKFFITASVQERAKRRYLELKAGGQERPIEQLEAEIAARDKTDSEREFAPLRQAEDAILVDTTHMSIEEVVRFVVKKAREAYPNDL